MSKKLHKELFDRFHYLRTLLDPDTKFELEEVEPNRYDVYKNNLYHTNLKVSAKTILSYIEDAILYIEKDIDTYGKNTKRNKFINAMKDVAVTQFSTLASEYSSIMAKVMNNKTTHEESQPLLLYIQLKMQEVAENKSALDNKKRIVYVFRTGTHTWNAYMRIVNRVTSHGVGYYNLPNQIDFMGMTSFVYDWKDGGRYFIWHVTENGLLS